MSDPTEKQIEAMAEKLLSKFPEKADPIFTYGQARYVLSLITPLVEALEHGIRQTDCHTPCAVIFPMKDDRHSDCNCWRSEARTTLYALRKEGIIG